MNSSSLQTAYCFLHQKQRVYQYSTMDWQRDDIECAIGSYVSDMDPELYAALSGQRSDYLLNHASFGADLLDAVTKMEKMMGW